MPRAHTGELPSAKAALKERCPAAGTYWKHKVAGGVYVVVAPTIFATGDGQHYAPGVAYRTPAVEDPPNHWFMALDTFLAEFAEIGEADYRRGLDEELCS